ncbi:hypothetical protein G6L28_22215 [Agrobacterium larrymoorei]|uniref:hypothetical protein n=1 Tax=Agrobacterium larrymoorei TaxID=160699 RepID=UPI001572A575|nr:hypothetical protein [Agrobacterium larrymoorei]NTJ45287.1 hypothetical protein [Agrobacterium larrymoorei]
MSALNDHLGAVGSTILPNNFHRIQPQVLRKILFTFNDAILTTVGLIGDVRHLEPRFTRQLASCFEDARDAAGGGRYHIEHQGELPIVDQDGRVIAFRRLDIRILFSQQVGRRGDYLCIECKYLDANNRSSDDEYVAEGVDRIVTGAYALGHGFAIMAGLERVGPMTRTIANVDDRLRRRYGSDQGLRAAPRWKLDIVRESEHQQNGTEHRIVLVHGFWPITTLSKG